MGFIWYHPKFFGTAWMKLNGFTPESLSKGNMPLIFGLCYLFGVMLSAALVSITIHQMSIHSIFAGDPALKDPNSVYSVDLKHVMETYGNRFRYFRHGALHGAIAAFFVAFPVIGTNAVFERHGFRYIAIHTGYWVLTLSLMGGCVCQFF